MKDYRYFERFGGLSIGRLAKEVENIEGWKRLDGWATLMIGIFHGIPCRFRVGFMFMV